MSTPSSIGPSGDHSEVKQDQKRKYIENDEEEEQFSSELDSESEETILSASLNFSTQKNNSFSSENDVKLTESISPVNLSTTSSSTSATSVRSAPPDLLHQQNISNNTNSIHKEGGGEEESKVVLNIVPEKEEQGKVGELPTTVTVLKHGNATVYLVGTAHFSTQSQDDVRKTIQLTQPNRVLLELCHSRRNILSLDEETILREAQDIGWKKLQQTMTSGKSGIQGILHLVLLSMSAQLTKKLGMAPGGEFRAAMQEARKLTNCLVILGDRPFNVTLSRALASLSFTQKVKLAWQFLSSPDDITKEEIERCKERDLLEKMLLEMTGEFPSITKVFVTERDEYLAHSLYLASIQKQQEEDKSDGKPIVVVGVVGMGHVPGICKYFGKTNDTDIQEISRLPPADKRYLPWLLGKTFKYTTYGLLAYGAFKILSRNEFIVNQTKAITHFVMTATNTKITRI